MHTERIELTIIVDDDHDIDEIAPAVEALGVECESYHETGTVIGHIAVSGGPEEILERLRAIPGVSWAGSALVFKVLKQR